MRESTTGYSRPRICAECGKTILVVDTINYVYKIMGQKTATSKFGTNYYCSYSHYRKNKKGLEV